MFGFGKKDAFDALYGKGGILAHGVAATPLASHNAHVIDGKHVPVIQVSDLPNAQFEYRWHDGESFAGGFGPTQLLIVDYWTLRARSAQLFETNLYARGIVRRFVTNIIATGLSLESVPEEDILGFKAEELEPWTENVERRFEIWDKNPQLCDQAELGTFGEIQKAALIEALVCGDVLVTLIQDPKTGLPRVHLVPGSEVQTPMGQQPKQGENRIVHGVELDKNGRHVAFHVLQEDGKTKRLPAYGKTGRRLAWLVYGSDKRHCDVRGQPLLGLVLQSLREIDRYRESAQRKATINSMLAMWIEKAEDVLGSLAFSSGAKKRVVPDPATDGKQTRRLVHERVPGWVVEELNHGEKIHGFNSAGTDEKFSDFEAAIVYAIAWALEVPPEVLTLSFRNNYSASQAAINEFKIYLDVARTKFGNSFCQPIYVDWLISQALTRRIEARGFLEAWRDPQQYDTFGAWIGAEWFGQIKPTTDGVKQMRAVIMQLNCGLITFDTAARQVTGQKWSRVVKRQMRERKLLAEMHAAGQIPGEEVQGTVPQKGGASASDLRTVVSYLSEYVDRLEDTLQTERAA
jgi:lambda family phage portal protein